MSKTLLYLIIIVVGIDAAATIMYDDVSCVMANHQWLTIIGAALISAVVARLMPRKGDGDKK